MIDAFLVGLVAGYGIAIPVGAIAILIVQVGMRCGFACAASAGAGAATGDLAYSVLAVTGGAALATAVADVGEPFRWLSAGVLAAMAIHGLIRSGRQPEAAAATMPRPREYAGTYVRFLGLTVVNPMTVVYFAAVVLGLGLAQDLTRGEAVWFVAGVFLASLSWQLVLAAVGAIARRHLPHRFVTSAVVAGNLLVLGMAGWIALR